MIIDSKAEIVKIYDTEIRGSNFEVTGIMLKIKDTDYYVEATGHNSSICNGFQVGNPVNCKIQWYSNQDKKNPNKYWNNINLIKIELDIEQPFETVEEKKQEGNNPFENDLPF
jgi:hypothetical protein